MYLYTFLFQENKLTITVTLVPRRKSVMSGDHRTVIKGAPSQYVKLNVGGSLHYTTIGTLTKHDSMLRAMFSGRMEVLTDSEGNISKFYIFYYIIFSSDF